ncbi:hypothetical protein ACFCZ2_06800 [Streptomyces sp. NPDC056202]|uniref:hypothetical protein n=1 Tax=unclassified Streptomyces TaxID=2593676 RepID=UPI0035E0DC53
MNFVRERRGSVFLLLAPALLLGAAVLAGAATESQGGLTLLSWPREQALLLTGVILILLAAAVLRGLVKSPLRAISATLLLLLGVPSTWIGGILLSGRHEEEVKTQAAPDRSGRRLVLVQYNNFDPERCLYVHQDGPLGERSWTVACFMGEEGYGLQDATWTASDRVRITLSGLSPESYEVDILPSGQPERVLLYGSVVCPGDLRGDCRDS